MYNKIRTLTTVALMALFTLQAHSMPPDSMPPDSMPPDSLPPDSLAVDSLAASPAFGQKLVPRHNLHCSAEFPCPEQIQRRVHFWLQVFGKWDKSQVILHDANAPWRSFAVIKGVNTCNKKSTQKKRQQLRANLLALADNLKAGKKPQGAIQQQLANQYDTLSSQAVSHSANNLRCQQGVKDQFERAVGRFHRYSPMTRRIVQAAGMPEELIYLPFVESSYRPNAYSKAGAAGMWQIMPNTARSLGMELNATLDERLDPEAATRGAMRYFKKAQTRLGGAARAIQPSITAAQLNPFMVTSYNYGINGMHRAIKKIGPDFYQVLDNYKSASFQVAVKNFYASFLAARHLAIHSATYFPHVKPLAPLKYQTLLLQNAVSLARITQQFNLSEAQIKKLNPALTRFVWNNWRLIPAGYRLHLPYDKDSWRQEIAALRALNPEVQAVNKSVYRVRPGDTACAIANAFKVNCKALISVNGLGKKAVIRIGQRLDIPVRVANAATQVAAIITQTDGLYTVKPGDSACKIAQQFNASCKEIIRLNKLGRNAKIFIGQKLTVPNLRLASTKSAATTAKASEYKVRAGDTLCQIAARFDVNCAKLASRNKLNNKSLIIVGQTLKLPDSGGLLASAATPTAQQQWVRAIDNLGEINIKIRANKASIRVLANETIWHYADWLGIRDSNAIRRMNGLSQKAVLPLGKRLILPAVNAQSKQHFESKRSEYHQVLSEQFKTRFALIGQKTIAVQATQTLSSIAAANNIPLWLLLRFNADIPTKLAIGQKVTLPLIQAK